MSQLIINDLTIDIVRKSIKNLHLGVYPPDGRVRVASPLRLSDDSVRLFVIAKLPWIRKQQAKFAAQVRQTEREYIRRESHYIWGRRYLLEIEAYNGPTYLELRPQSLILHTRPGSTETHKQKAVLTYYREQLKERIPTIIEKYEPLIEVEVAEWGVKLMRTKWGTCNIDDRRIWLNLELAKKPVHCLEYLVVHEMAHLLERHHNNRFRDILDKHMPNWRDIREELNEFIL